MGDKRQETRDKIQEAGDGRMEIGDGRQEMGEGGFSEVTSEKFSPFNLEVEFINF